MEECVKQRAGRLVDQMLDAVSIRPEDAIAAHDHWSETYAALVEAHPAHLLTIRNTRSALRHLGYRFPDRRFEAPELVRHDGLAGFYEAVDAYLETAFGSLESAAATGVSRNIGFAKSTYRQRLASSLAAARLSLQRRAAKVERLMQEGAIGNPEFAEEDIDGGSEDQNAVVEVPVRLTDGLRFACQKESARLKDLLRTWQELGLRDAYDDPKLDAMLKLVAKHLRDRDRILVFSGYTDTLDACLEGFQARFAGQFLPPHALYTGGAAWIDLGSGPTAASKEDIRKALEQGEVEVVFCSDAASEGLNLQAARVLDQRRCSMEPCSPRTTDRLIARLGQRADSVLIYNLWYPDSMEAKMYEKLLQRRNLYELAVGEFPDIFSAAIRDELAARFHPDQAMVADPLDVLQRLREEHQYRAMSRVWRIEVSDTSESQAIRDGLIDVVMETASALGFPTEREGDVLFVETDSGSRFPLTASPGEQDSILSDTSSARSLGASSQRRDRRR